jgi:hypothetical protein
MRLEYENGVILVENAQGRRWQLSNAEKPKLKFEFDALLLNDEHALRRVGQRVQPLSAAEIAEVKSFIEAQEPPPGATLQKQLIGDLKAFAYGLINSVLAQLEYDSLLDAQITGRPDSGDLYADEARRLLGYVDSIWNAFYGLAAQIEATPDAELKTIRDYANMLPMVPPLDHFTSGPLPAPAKAKAAAPKSEPATVAASQGESPVSVVVTTPENADFKDILNRALIFDDFYSETQLRVLQEWALKTPHWMLTNSTYNEKGEAMHRLWGASYIEAWQRQGWPGLPPVLYSAIASVFRKLKVTITEPEYIGLNGQGRDQDASMHSDCDLDSPDDLSILIYLGEDTTGDLNLYDKNDRSRLLHTIAYKPNRVVAFDGSIPHQAFAPKDDKFRMSIIIRGKYRVGVFDLGGICKDGTAAAQHAAEA